MGAPEFKLGSTQSIAFWIRGHYLRARRYVGLRPLRRVRGAPDAAVEPRARELSSSTVRLLYLRGVVADGSRAACFGRVAASRNSRTCGEVTRLLRPLVSGDSPYAMRVVALIDAARASEAVNVANLRRVFTDRLVEVPTESIEEYLPDTVYESAGLVRLSVLVEIAAAPPDRGR